MPNKKFHTHCFICAQCSAPLKEAYSTRAGKPHCLSCYDPTSNIAEATQSALDVNRPKASAQKPAAAPVQNNPPAARPTCEMIQEAPAAAPEPVPEPAKKVEKIEKPLETKPSTEEDAESKKAFEKAETDRLMKYEQDDDSLSLDLNYVARALRH
eukprot:CAMPEP_0206200072 /NCGR_PEP_ID=MMETSP0166-20121206/10662_1 /ASSEMBLY_ACC=CAM_ASM_000260 /TAXON_ID=95228 /ORGANISM="Vannella robusta, Strain DIVA3 518/3/11/1/6" /LENGTH=154 /DNA_ID=CAMNT_0053618341 /DNA_START=266 /DNA_END=728 /DNA_ORIENTATION=+